MKSVTLALVTLLVSGSVYASTYSVWLDSRAAAFGNTGFNNACVSKDGKFLKSIAPVKTLSCTTVSHGGNEGAEESNCVVVTNKVAVAITSTTQQCVAKKDYFNTHSGSEGGGEESCEFKAVTSTLSTTQYFQNVLNERHGGQDGFDETTVISTGSYKIPACK
jgi:hypothetical protein